MFFVFQGSRGGTHPPAPAVPVGTTGILAIGDNTGKNGRKTSKTENRNADFGQQSRQTHIVLQIEKEAK